MLDRASSYIGVMIDDLTLQGVTEPYRMMTARAEYRLQLRADNAETRLSGLAGSLGCLSDIRIDRIARREAARQEIAEALAGSLSATDLARRGAALAQDGTRRTGQEWLQAGIADVEMVAPGISDWADPEVLTEMVEDARYAPYAARQAAEVVQLRQAERRSLPAGLVYQAIPGLSAEMVERLSAARPHSLGAAGRLRGVTPAALTAILLHLERAA